MQDRLVKELRLAGINDMDSANIWLAQGHYISDHNRRFAVMPKDATDAHLAYAGTDEALQRTCSVQVTKTLSKNLSCQHENQLLQVVTTGTGQALRGAKVTLHEHFDGGKELFWKQRKLDYTVLDKPLRQALPATGKEVNARVNQAVMRRNTGHKPALDHPWRNRPIGKPREGYRVSL